MHVPEVANDGGSGGSEALCAEEAQRGVEHMAAVLRGCGAEEKGRLDDQEDSHNDEHKVENLKQPARFLEQDTGEEGDDDGLDRGDHGNVGNGKVAHRIEVPDKTDPSGKASEEKEEAPTSKKQRFGKGKTSIMGRQQPLGNGSWPDKRAGGTWKRAA